MEPLRIALVIVFFVFNAVVHFIETHAERGKGGELWLAHLGVGLFLLTLGAGLTLMTDALPVRLLLVAMMIASSVLHGLSITRATGAGQAASPMSYVGLIVAIMYMAGQVGFLAGLSECGECGVEAVESAGYAGAAE